MGWDDGLVVGIAIIILAVVVACAVWIVGSAFEILLGASWTLQQKVVVGVGLMILASLAGANVNMNK